MAERSTEEHRTCNYFIHFWVCFGYSTHICVSYLFSIHRTEHRRELQITWINREGVKWPEIRPRVCQSRNDYFERRLKTRIIYPAFFTKLTTSVVYLLLDQGNKQFRRLKLRFSLSTNLEKGSVSNIQNVRYHLQYLPQKCLSLISWTTGSSSMQTQAQSQSRRTLGRIDHCHQWLCTIQNSFLQQLCRPGNSFSFHSVYQ